VVAYPRFYIVFVVLLFVSTAYVDFIEGSIDGVGKDFIWEDNDVVIVFLCFVIV